MEAGDGLAVVGVLCRGVDVAAPDERRTETVRLQLHGVQGEPVPSRHGIVPSTHGKAGDQRRVAEYLNDSAKLS